MMTLVFENISKDSPPYNEELFGPVFSLFSVKNDLEAVNLANDTEYGLAAAVFSKDVERAYKVA